MGAFARDVARLKCAFHPTLGGFGRWGLVEREVGVSIASKSYQATNTATTNLKSLDLDDPNLITRGIVVVGAATFGGKVLCFVDFYGVFTLVTAGKTRQNTGTNS